MGALRICLFGRVRVALDGGAQEIRMTPTAQTLLAFLLLQRTFSPRDVLASLCWGDQPDEQARNCLNTALWRLRRALEGEHASPCSYLLTTPTGEVGFNWESDHWLDVTTFEHTAAPVLAAPAGVLTPNQAAGLESALSLYTGDLLEGFYDDWALRQRERVRSMYLDSLARLMRYHHARGAYAEGLAAGQQLLAHDPLREEIHREMMRLYLKAGDRALAVRQYNACREILADELGIAPMTETEALYREVLRADAAPAVISVVSAAPLAGQAAVAQALTNLRQAVYDFEHARDRLRRAVHFLERLTDDADGGSRM